MVPSDTELTLRTTSNCETLEMNEMMHTLSQVLMSLTFFVLATPSSSLLKKTSVCTFMQSSDIVL